MVIKTKVSKLIKKGALNLYKNYNYMREVPTEDIDYSCLGDIDTTKEEIIGIINNINNEIYKFEVIKVIPIPIPSNGLGGYALTIEMKIKCIKSTYTIHIDLSYETLLTPTGLITNKDNVLCYTIERSLCDKFEAMIQKIHNSGQKTVNINNNTREKDFYDFSRLYENCNKRLLFTLIESDMKNSQYSDINYKIFKDNYKEIKFIKEYQIENIIEEILNNIKK